MGSSSQNFPLQQYQNINEQTIFSIFANGVVELFNNVTINTGFGSPNGQVTAVVGSIYSQVDSPGSNALWVKQTGSGNTGWVSVSSGVTGNATSIQGIPVSPATPSDGQTFVYSFAANQWQPTSGTAAATHNIRYSTDFVWAQTGSPSNFPALTANTPATVTLTPCPAGIDTTANPNLGDTLGAYSVYISGTGTAEPVRVSGGTCTPGAGSGTIQFTPLFNHTTGYTVGTATAGIQEAINDGCGFSATVSGNGNCNIVLPPNGTGAGAYTIYATIFWHANNSVLTGKGATLSCVTRGPCIQIGNLTNQNAYNNNVMEGFSVRGGVVVGGAAYAGSQIASIQRVSGLTTIQTVAAHGYQTGDTVIQAYCDLAGFVGTVPFITVVDSTHYTYTRTGQPDVANTPTIGSTILCFAVFRDNAQNTYYKNVVQNTISHSSTFSVWWDMWDDEETTIEGFNNFATALTRNSLWCGAFVWSGGAIQLPNNTQQLAPVITIKNAIMTLNGSSGVIVLNSNGVFIRDSVMQSQGLHQVYVSNILGNFQGADLQNVYTEAAPGLNPGPIGSALTPYYGCGSAGLQLGPRTSAGTNRVSGFMSPAGVLPSGGSGSTAYVYFLVVRDGTSGGITDPLPIYQWQESSPTASVTFSWPRFFSNAASPTITYDIIRVPGILYFPPGSNPATYPYGVLAGGSVGAPGSVATGLAQCTGYVCTFTDNTGVATSGYTPPFSNAVSSTNFTIGSWFFPGNLVTHGDSPVVSDFPINSATLWANFRAVVVSPVCGNTQVGRGYINCISTSSAPNSSYPTHAALMLPDGNPGSGGPVANSKGRLNFIHSQNSSVVGYHFITLMDSNPGKTMGTSGNRPVADAADVWIGTDNPGNLAVSNNVPLAFGAGSTISNYIGNVGDGSSWLERLTSAKKQFAVPVQMASYTFATLPTPTNGYIVYCSDCTIANPCAAAGTGAFAKRIAGSWVCN